MAAALAQSGVAGRRLGAGKRLPGARPAGGLKHRRSCFCPSATLPGMLVNNFVRPSSPPRFSAVSTLSLFGGIVLSPLASPPPGSPPLYMSSAQVVSQPYGLRDGLSDSLKNKW